MNLRSIRWAVSGIARQSLLPVLALGLCGPAASTGQAEPTPEQLEARLLEMQVQMSEMRNQMELLQTQLAALKDKGAEEVIATAPPTASPAQTASPPSATSKYPVRFYGKVKMDVIYDSTDLGTDEVITFIPKDNEAGSQVSFTARETRLGIATGGPTFGDWNTSSRIETDFYGSAASSGSGSLRIRLAYVDLTNGRTTFRVGQDWLPIAAMNPATTNFTIMGYSGNLWGRIPQVTAIQEFSDNVAGVISTFRCRDAEDSVPGLTCDLEMPWVAAGLRLSGFLIDDEAPAFLGIGGAYRQGDVEGKNVSPNLVSAEFSLPWKPFELTGEIYTGQGLGGEFFHGGGAFNLRGEPIRTSGGFVQIGLRATQSLRLNLGYGYDNPLDSDVEANEFYRKNTSLFGNTWYDFTPGLSVVLEGTLVETTWRDGPEDGYRVQSSLVFFW